MSTSLSLYNTKLSLQFSLHLNMAQECMGIFEKDKLPTIGNVEQVRALEPFAFDTISSFSLQNCATGVTTEGKVPKTLVEEMVPILDSRDAQYVVPCNCHFQSLRNSCVS